jgi:hypothetical protein
MTSTALDQTQSLTEARIHFEVLDGVATVTLNRPDRLTR